jgi:adenylate cyclase
VAAARLIPLGLGLGASVLTLLLQALGAFRGVELLATDGTMALRGRQPADPRLAIVAIDAASIDELGQWPWSRARMGELVERIATAGARTIALDLVFAEPSRRDAAVDLTWEDEALAAAIERAGNVVLGFYFRREPAAVPERGPASTAAHHGGDPANVRSAAIEQVAGEPATRFAVPERPAVEPNIDLLALAASSQGFFSNERRARGVLRHYDLVVAHQGAYYPALALRAVERFTGGGLRLAPAVGRAPRLLLGGEPVETDETGALWVNYRGPAGTYPTYPAADLLAGRIPTGALDGRLVFLGATEVGLGDLQATPLGGEMPGVEVHAQVADNLLNRSYVRDSGREALASLAALLLFGPLVAGLLTRSRHYLRTSLLAIALVLLWPGLCGLVFAASGRHLQVVSPAAAGLLALVAGLRYQIGFVDRRARQVRRLFERYVSPAVVAELLKDPERVALGGERRTLTVLFSDIRGFTDLAEKLDSERVARLLNQFFTPMTRVVLACGGTLDKYMGDALMAFFGAPIEQADHAARACRTALGMRRELARLNASWQARGDLPQAAALGIGIGLSTGEMTVGNLGSEEVFDYTVIGDAVNLGSRLEGLNRLYGTTILTTEATVKAAGDRFLFRELDRVRVKGKELAVTVYELMAAEPASPRDRQRALRFETGLAAYRNREFGKAERFFASILEDLVADGSEDGPASLYVERCRRLRAEPPPPGWDAVETLSVK